MNDWRLAIILGTAALLVIFWVWHMLKLPPKSENSSNDEKIRQFAADSAAYYGTSGELSPAKAIQYGQEIIAVLAQINCREAKMLLTIAEEAVRERRYPIPPERESAESKRLTTSIGEVLRWMWEFGFPEIKIDAVA